MHADVCHHSAFERRTANERSTDPRPAYLPGLDALRALAVICVVTFHLDPTLLPGGFLGVSLFFTLSGFLITRNFLGEISRTSTVSLRGFWVRRARRLFPAAWLVLAVVASAAIASPRLAAGIGFTGGDGVAALANVANWRFMSAGSSYAALFRSPSPLLHFWSIAVEEQAYVVVGLLVAWSAWRGGPRARRFLLPAALIAATVSWLLPMLTSMSVTRAYYGTDTRIGEIFAGVVLACVRAHPHRRWSRALTASAFVVLVVLMRTTSSSSSWLARGMLPLVAAVSVTLIVSAADQSSGLARLGATSLVGGLGRLSYVIYLVHWPLILVLQWLGARFRSALAMAGAGAMFVAVAWVIARLVERPIRAKRWPALAVGLAGLVAVSLVVGAATWWRPPPPESQQTLAALERRAVEINSGPVPLAATPATMPPPATPAPSQPVLSPPPPTQPSQPAPPVPTTPPPAPTPIVVRALGDSILLSIVLSTTLDDGLTLAQAPHDLELGCGITDFGERQVADVCRERTANWSQQAVVPPPQAALVMSCQWESVDRTIPGEREPSHLGDPQFDAFVQHSYDSTVDALIASGVSIVLWVRCPYFSGVVGVDGLNPDLRASRARERTDRLNELIEQTIAGHPGVACAVPFDDWVNSRIDDAALRPDGSHFDFEHARAAGDEFAELVIESYRTCLAGARTELVTDVAPAAGVR